MAGSYLSLCFRRSGTFLTMWHLEHRFDLAANNGSTAMATQIIMDLNGDTRHNFDAKDVKAHLEAERHFKALTGAGFTAATRTGSGESVVTRPFDPTVEETLFFPRLVGSCS